MSAIEEMIREGARVLMRRNLSQAFEFAQHGRGAEAFDWGSAGLLIARGERVTPEVMSWIKPLATAVAAYTDTQVEFRLHKNPVGFFAEYFGEVYDVKMAVRALARLAESIVAQESVAPTGAGLAVARGFVGGTIELLDIATCDRKANLARAGIDEKTAIEHVELKIAALATKFGTPKKEGEPCSST